MDPIRELYETLTYPAMSHPVSDPAVSSVAARLGGLQTPHPASARILEIGCASGHNLIPLAMRWPECFCEGIDLSENAIRDATDLAQAAGVRNVAFHTADLRDFTPAGGPYDFIIAHGFLSWVPDEVKSALLEFCRKNLSPSGIATVSFNLECGWSARWPVIQKTRAIHHARGGDLPSALEILRFITEPGSPEIAIIDDMLAKGPAILACDDFAPVNDPWSLMEFTHAAASAGLRWLGESDPAGNLPSCLDEAMLTALAATHLNPLDFQHAADVAAGRTFRSAVLCRADAPVSEPIASRVVLDFSARAGVEPKYPHDLEIWQAVRLFEPACVPLRQVLEQLPQCDPGEFATRVAEGISKGWIYPRIEPHGYLPDPPEAPCLNRFRLLCAANHLPLVDEWHQPCQFPEKHYEVLALMDGTRPRAALAAFSRIHCPELAFEPWLRHLAQRGMFA